MEFKKKKEKDKSQSKISQELVAKVERRLNHPPLNGREYFETILRMAAAAHMLACRRASQISVNHAMAIIPILWEVLAMRAHTASHHWCHRRIRPALSDVYRSAASWANVACTKDGG